MALNWKELLVSLAITPSNRNYNCKQDLRLFMNAKRELWLDFVEQYLSLGIFVYCFFLSRQKTSPNPSNSYLGYCSLLIFSAFFTVCCFTSLILHSYVCLYSSAKRRLLLHASPLIYMICQQTPLPSWVSWQFGHSILSYTRSKLLKLFNHLLLPCRPGID